MQDGGSDRWGAAGRTALLLALLMLAPMLFARGMLPPDEARYADVALAMHESGDWLVPRLYQKWYAEKPPVFFWGIAALHEAGVLITVAPRLVSLLAALGTLLCLPRLARSAGLDAGAARRGMLVLATMPLFLLYGQLGFLDALLLLEVTLAATCTFARAATPPARSGARCAWAAAEGALLGLALLTKGPVALLFPASLRAGAALGRQRRGAGFAGLDLLVVAIAAGIGLAWLLAARAHAGADYVDRIFWGQLSSRIAGSEPKHPAPPGFLLVVVLAGALPWSVLALGARAPWRWRDLLRPDPRLAALCGWGFLPVVFLALLPSQQPHYALPALPPLALLVGAALAHPVREGARRAVAALGVVLATALLGTVAIGAAGIEPAWLPAVLARRLAGDRVLEGAMALGGLGLLGAVAWRRPGVAANAPLRALAGVVALFASLPLVAWRTHDLVNGRTLVESPAIGRASRLVAPTGLRSPLRLRTRLPLVEEYDERDLAQLLRDDPALVAVEWRKDLERSALLDRVRVVARGWFSGREILAVTGPPRPRSGAER